MVPRSIKYITVAALCAGFVVAVPIAGEGQTSRLGATLGLAASGCVAPGGCVPPPKPPKPPKRPGRPGEPTEPWISTWHGSVAHDATDDSPRPIIININGCIGIGCKAGAEMLGDGADAWNGSADDALSPRTVTIREDGLIVLPLPHLPETASRDGLIRMTIPWSDTEPIWMPDALLGYFSDPSQGGGGSKDSPPDSLDPRCDPRCSPGGP